MQRIALFFVVLFAFVANAQNNGTLSPARQMLSSPDAFADGHLAALDKQLSLAEDLKPPLREVLRQEGQQLIAILGDSSLSEPQKLVLIRHVHVVARRRIWNLLNHGYVQQVPQHAPPPMLVTQAEPHPVMH